jgi:hypothetical protein
MMKEMAVFIVLAILVLPIASSAQSSNSSGKSIEDLNAASVPEGSIVVLSTEETELPGYVHQRYAYACFGEFQLVDYYGAPIEPKDSSILATERAICVRKHFNMEDGAND